MRAALFLSLVALASGQSAAGCDTPTCFQCQKLTGCNWYTAGSALGACYSNTSVPAQLNYTATAAGACPACQAGTCLDCQNQTGCAWYANSIGALGGTCYNGSSTPPSPVGSYTKVNTCPSCTSYLDCATCTSNENATCGWYSLAGVSSGKCAEASPGFLYSKTNAAFCSGNICAGLANCTSCQAQNANNSGACAWYVPASGFTALYNPKCDINGSGIVNSNLYNSVTTCPPCTDATCSACQAEPNCQWLAIQALGQTAFGQCVVTGNTVTGKTVVGTCPAQCQLYACAQCVAATGCQWFTTAGTAASGLRDTCDRTTDAYLHPASKPINTTATCPSCRSTRCYECNTEGNGCTWYAATALGHIIPATDYCYKTGQQPSISPTPIPTTDSKCAGNPNSAIVALPGLAFLATLFV